MSIYIINGKPSCGKTTFEQMVARNVRETCYIFSTVDFVKEIALQCGWDGEKTLKNRKFLSDMKDLLTEWDNVPFKKILEKVNKVKEDFGYKRDYIIFIDCREPKEIEKLCNALNAQSLLIRRESVENQVVSNHADEEVLDYNYDIIINNNRTLTDLEKTVNFFIEEEGYHLKIENPDR